MTWLGTNRLLILLKIMRLQRLFTRSTLASILPSVPYQLYLSSYKHRSGTKWSFIYLFITFCKDIEQRSSWPYYGQLQWQMSPCIYVSMTTTVSYRFSDNCILLWSLTEMILVHSVTEYCCKWLKFGFVQNFYPYSQNEYNFYLDYI